MRTLFVVLVCLVCALAHAGEIAVTDANVLAGLSPYNWICKEDSVSTTVCGASFDVAFKGTRQVMLKVDSSGMGNAVADRFPIIAWTVNGGAIQTHQLAPNETSIRLASDVENPKIELYVKGMSPFEDRWTGDIPANSFKFTGFSVDEGGATRKIDLPTKVWLNIGDSIMSGDGAAYAKGQGRPKTQLWAASDDGRASYGYLLAKHFGYRESRIAFGGYNWRGGLAKVPALSTLIDQRSEKVSRLSGDTLSPLPDVVLINLGENGVPAEKDVVAALEKVRSRIGRDAKLIVMTPLSGRAVKEISAAWTRYSSDSKDKNTHLVEFKPRKLSTADGQHPTAAGHEAVFKAALESFEPIISPAK